MAQHPATVVSAQLHPKSHPSRWGRHQLQQWPHQDQTSLGFDLLWINILRVSVNAGSLPLTSILEYQCEFCLFPGALQATVIKGWNIICYCSNCFHRPKMLKPRPKAPCVTHYTKRNNRKVVLPPSTSQSFLREEMAEGGTLTAWGIPGNGSLVSRISSNFSLPGAFSGFWRHHFCACCRNWGTAGVGTSYLQCSNKWAFLWMTLPFYLLFWTNHIIKEQNLTFALTLLASTVPACCLWPLPEIHICWASCCLLWLSLHLFLLWLQWWFYLPISLSSVERRNF